MTVQAPLKFAMFQFNIPMHTHQNSGSGIGCSKILSKKRFSDGKPGREIVSGKQAEESSNKLFRPLAFFALRKLRKKPLVRKKPLDRLKI